MTGTWQGGTLASRFLNRFPKKYKAQFMGEKDDDGVANLEAGDEDHCQEVAWEMMIMIIMILTVVIIMRIIIITWENVLCVLHARQHLQYEIRWEWRLLSMMLMHNFQ